MGSKATEATGEGTRGLSGETEGAGLTKGGLGFSATTVKGSVLITLKLPPV